MLRRSGLVKAREIRESGDVGFGLQRPLVAISLPLTPYPLLLLVTSSARLTQPVMSSGAGRRAALACGVETFPEECEGCLLLSGALSDVGTGVGSETGFGVRSRLNGARTTPGISPCARYSRLVEMTGCRSSKG